MTATNYVDHHVKDKIAVAIEHIFNKDERMKYKVFWFEHFYNQLNGIVNKPESWST
jgi:hypothetical protein